MKATTADIRALRAFVLVAEELHFGRAAQRMGLSQPSLTQQIKYLEAQLGHSLFRRNNRQVALTDHGARLVDEARTLVGRADAFLRLALDPAIRTSDGPLNIGYQALSLVSAGRDFFTRIFSNCPGVRPVLHEMHTTQQVEALQRGILDIGTINRPAGYSTLRLHRLVVEECVLAMPEEHPLAKHERISFTALRTTPLCLPRRHFAPGIHDATISACIAAGFSPNIAHETRAFYSALSIASTGLAVSIVPRSVGTLGMPGVTWRGFRGRAPVSELFAAWDPANSSDVLRQAVEQLGPAV
jgi:DNA-binding transcriptional LysR family regulator